MSTQLPSTQGAMDSCITFEQLLHDFPLLMRKIDGIVKTLEEPPGQSKKGASQHAVEIPVSIKRASIITNLSVPTLYGKVSRREIPFNKRGSRLYFYESELATWIKQGRVKTVSEIEAEADAYLQTRKKA